LKLNFRTSKEKDGKSDVTLVVTGQTSDKGKEELEKKLATKGIKAVVTSEPVLGVFDL
jgi:hypothetical protein